MAIQAIFIFGLLAGLLFQNGNAEPEAVILNGIVGTTSYDQNHFARVTFILPEDGSEPLVYPYPANVTEADALKEGSKVSYQLTKSGQSLGYPVRDKAVNVQYLVSK